jgi:chorismate mutase
VGAVATAYVPWLKKNETAVIKFVKGVQMAAEAIRDPARTNQVRDAVRKTVYPDLNEALFASLWEEAVRGVLEKSPQVPEILRAKMKQVFDFNNSFAKPGEQIDDSMVDPSFTNEYVIKARALK